MNRYSEELKASIIEKMMPPQNVSVSRLVAETGISDGTLYTWRKQARLRGKVVPGDGKNPANWSSEDKFAVVLESAAMNESELAEYCRKKGLYSDQIAEWREACVSANANKHEQTRQFREQLKQERKCRNKLERELKRKEKALAEAAALLVLRKKADAIWGDGEDA